jgi:RimJ/RimL family protein N-acetyltransferase
VRRPLHAAVAKHNVGSIRVLEKCGFAVVGEEEGEYVLRLTAD